MFGIRSKDSDTNYKGRILAIILWAMVLTGLATTTANVSEGLRIYYLYDVATIAVLLLMHLGNRLGYVPLASMLTKVFLVLEQTLLFEEPLLKTACVVFAIPIFIASFLFHGLASWLLVL